MAFKTKTKNKGKPIKFVYFINGDIKGELCLKECAKPSDFKELEVNAPDISSTDVREELAATGKTTKVSKNVMAYIKKNGLYGSK